MAAQDFIVLKDGNIIEAKVTEISPTEIRYLRFDNMDGPVIVLPAADVLSIRYENGTSVVINAAAESPREPALNPDKWLFAFNANGGSALMLFAGSLQGNGLSFCFEVSKGHFNMETNIIIPIGTSTGFGGLFTFNYFQNSQIGGFYLGGGLGVIWSWVDSTRNDLWHYDSGWSQTSGTMRHTEINYTAGLNAGYKFITKSGVYFCVGAFIGLSYLWTSDWCPEPDFFVKRNEANNEFGPLRGQSVSFYFKPDLTVGYAFTGKRSK